MPRRSNNKPPNVKQRGGQPEEYSWVQRERPAKFGDHRQIKIDVPGLFFVALLVVFVLRARRIILISTQVAARAVAHGVMTRTGRFQPVWKRSYDDDVASMA